jgi:RNA polymerase sigma-70 factor (ECF subfamily)
MAEADAELVERVRLGDSTAFEMLVRRYFRMAFLIALAQLLNRQDAEDVCQDAFIRCWERIHDCREPERVGAWIGRIVRNMAHNRREFLGVRTTRPLEAADGIAAEHGADRTARQNELRARLSAALLTLSVPQREVVLLHDLEGFRHAEIAVRLGISEMMSRRHLSDARKRLRVELGDLATVERDDD